MQIQSRGFYLFYIIAFFTPNAGKCVLRYAAKEGLLCVQLWGGGQCEQYQPGNFSM